MKVFFSKTSTYACLMMMLLVSLSPLKVFAVDYGFYSSNDILFYDPSADCSGSNDSSSGLFDGTNATALRYPSCVTDDNKFIKIIDEYIKNYSASSPMNGLGKDFVKYGKQYNVNPAWAVAMAQHETSLGSAGVGQSCTNAFGIRTHSPYPDCSTGFSKYSSFSQSIQDFNKLVSGPTYLGNPKNKTLLDIINIYAPVGDGSNDPSAYVKALLQPMTDIMKQACDSWSLSSSPNDTSNSSASSSSSDPVVGVDVLKGHRIPVTHGKVGGEQHLSVFGPKGDGGSITKHYQLTNVPANQRNGFAGTGKAYSLSPTTDPQEEKYYIAMRWLYAHYSGGNIVSGPESSSWYKQTRPRVLVTNPKTKKQIIAVALDWGPAESTGLVSGLTPEAGQAVNYQNNADLEYAWAKDQTLPPGPVGGSASDIQQPPATTSNSSCGNSSGGDLGVAPSGFTFPLITTQDAIKNQKPYAWCYQSKTNCHGNYGNYMAADIMSDEGTTVVAAVDGKVISAPDVACGAGGNIYNVPRVIIDGKDQYWYYYTHMKPGSIKVKDGQTVKAGDELGQVGPSACAEGTDPHVHFQISTTAGTICSRAAGGCTSGSTIDPQPWLIEAFKYLPVK